MEPALAVMVFKGELAALMLKYGLVLTFEEEPPYAGYVFKNADESLVIEISRLAEELA